MEVAALVVNFHFERHAFVQRGRLQVILKSMQVISGYDILRLDLQVRERERQLLRFLARLVLDERGGEREEERYHVCSREKRYRARVGYQFVHSLDPSLPIQLHVRLDEMAR